MSLFRVSRLSVALCPDQLGIVHRSPRGETQRELVTLAGAAERGDWSLALASLTDWVNTAQLRRARMSMVLSSRFVRFALMPWQNAHLKADEELAWCRVQFERLYGDMSGWRFSFEPMRYGRTRVVCAVPEELILGVHSLCPTQRVTCGAVVPYFVSAWNHWRRELCPGQLFGVAESAVLVVGTCGDVGWQGLRALASRTTSAELLSVVRREQMLQVTAEPLPPKIHMPGLTGLRETKPPVATAEVEWLNLPNDHEAPALAMARLAELG